jgi:TetR/AcrR family transcriptional regulator, cholesterol catabolism regulator
LLADAQEAGALAPDIDLVPLKFALIGMMNWTLEWRMAPGTAPVDLADRFYRIAIEGAAQ